MVNSSQLHVRSRKRLIEQVLLVNYTQVLMSCFYQSEDEEAVHEGMSNVVYIGHIPHGFYEQQIFTYSKQFGQVKRVHVARSGKVNIN